MPFTPFHGLALMFLHFRYEKRIDLLAVLVSATFVDLEPLYYMLVGEPIDHRIWHSIPMSLTIYPILITLGVYMIERLFEGRLWLAYGIFRLRPDRVKYTLSGIYICSLIGGFSHVFFDMFTHETMPYAIYPLADGNPFYLGPASIIVEVAVILLAIYSCLRWMRRRACSSSLGYEV